MDARRWIIALAIGLWAVAGARAETASSDSTSGPALGAAVAADELPAGSAALGELPEPIDADDALAAATPALETSAADAALSLNESAWLVNTRAIGGSCCSDQMPAWRWQRYDCGQGWRSAAWEDFQATDDPTVTTVVLIHGYRHSPENAVSEGLATWRRLRASCCSGKLRFVIWSWPTMPCNHRPVQDVAAKACRADVEARFLARFMSGINPQVRVSVIGYSLGGRVCCGALHLLAGGALNGRPIDFAAPERVAPVRAILVAAAVDEDWLMPNRRYGLATKDVERVAVLYNPHDMVLHHYRLLAHRGSVGAIGNRGVAGLSTLGEDAKKIQYRNTGGELGRRHGWSHFLASSSLMLTIRSQAMFLDLPAVTAVAMQQVSLPEASSEKPAAAP
ncbi:MAG: alpha/beta hydrolase [Planctomycetes bacterium]|nr:alpha/beta hydrolase [Planctomycetota bacterium]